MNQMPKIHPSTQRQSPASSKINAGQTNKYSTVTINFTEESGGVARMRSPSVEASHSTGGGPYDFRSIDGRD
jgi:hypothetical protein